MVNSKILRSFYYGVFYGGALALLVLSVAYFFYPLYKQHSTNSNFLINKGLVGSKTVGKKFFQSITYNDGVLIFGTSESGGLGTRPSAPNYPYYLGQYFGLKPFVYTRGGAGNTPYMWLSSLCDLETNSQVYYIVNPIYFTHYSLNSKDSILSYKERYLSEDTFTNAQRCVEKFVEQSLVMKFKEIFAEQTFKVEPLRNELAFFINEFYDTFIGGSVKFLGGDKDFKKLEVMDRDWSEIYNVADWIITEGNNSAYSRFEIPETFFESVRYTELLISKKVAEAKGVNLRFVLLPPNYTFFEAFKSKYPAQFKEILGALKEQLCDNNNCLDLSDENSAKGMFIDAMHFNAYGASFIADELIKDIGRNTRL